MNVGQLISVGVSGKSLTSEEKKFLTENQITGITLFARNIESPAQIKALCEELQACAPKDSPMMIAVDNEGGRVMRLRSPFTEWPALKKLGDLDSPEMSFQFAKFMGYELRSVGFNVDWAPCTDVFTNPKNTVIGDRAVSESPEQVARHASALIRGYLRAGIAPCAKHFPGHGHTIIDSHDDLPEEDLDLQRLKEVELIPFRQAILVGVPLIMTGHLMLKKIDPTWPVTLSEIFIKNILRTELSYNGLIVTDDLDMKALKNHYPMDVRVLRSLVAGADLLLFCNEPASPPLAIEIIQKSLRDGQLHPEILKTALNRVHRFKKSYLAEAGGLMDFQSIVGHQDHLALAQSIRNGQLIA